MLQQQTHQWDVPFWVPISVGSVCLRPSPDVNQNNVPLVWRTSVRYLGLTITSNLCWNNHCKIISAKATRCLNFLRHTLWGATPFVKSIGALY